MKLIPVKKEKDILPVWSLFDDFMDRFFNEEITDNSRIMAVDVLENSNEFKIKANLPGIPKENASISVKDNQLIINAHHEKSSEESEKGSIIRSERFTGTYQRIINLPENCDTENVKAKMENGVLLLTIPKKEVRPKKEIVIE